ncbi:MAG: GTP cyclohydrolase, FolE2/MptA family [Thermodesulfobacteriota bacterium]
MKDIQNLQDHRRISIEQVGVKEISYPVTVLDKAHSLQHSVARVNMSVNLPHHFKGTHMSRFIEALNKFHGEVNLPSLKRFLEEMRERLKAEQSHLEIEFPFFRGKGGSPSRPRNSYQCRMRGESSSGQDITLDIKVPIAPPTPVQTRLGMPESLGHWGDANISLRFRHFIWIEEIIDLVEEVTSHDLYWSPEEGKPANSPLSVESLAQKLGQRLSEHEAIRWFAVTVENLARGYTTFATIEGP